MARKKSTCTVCNQKFTDFWALPGRDAKRTEHCGKDRCKKVLELRELFRSMWGKAARFEWDNYDQGEWIRFRQLLEELL